MSYQRTMLYTFKARLSAFPVQITKRLMQIASAEGFQIAQNAISFVSIIRLMLTFDPKQKRERHNIPAYNKIGQV